MTLILLVFRLCYYVFFLPFEFLSVSFQYIWLCVSPTTVVAICGDNVNAMWSRYPYLRLETLYVK